MKNPFTVLPPVAWHALFSFLALWTGEYLDNYWWGAGLAVALNMAVSGITIYMEKEAPAPQAAPLRPGESAPVLPKPRSKLRRWLFG